MPADKARRAVSWLTGAILLLVCGFALCNNIINITMNPIIDEFSLTGANQGMMTSMINLGSMLALLLAPLLQGRASKLWMLVISGSVQALTLAFSGASSGFPMLLAACVLLGVGGGFTDSYANSYMVDLHPGNSARYLGYLHGCFGVGGLVTPLLVSYILARSGWRNVYWVSCCVFAAMFLAFLSIGLKTRRRIGVREAVSETRLSPAMLKSYLSQRRNIFLLLAGIFYGASQLGIVGWVARYMTLRFDAAQLGSICISVYWVCATISRFFTPLLKIRPLTMLIAGAGAAGVAHLAGVWIGTPVAMLVAVVLIGLLSGHCMPMLLGEAARGNEDKTSLTTSAMLFLICLSRMGMPLLMGAVSTASSIATAMLLPAVAAMLSAAFAGLAGRGESSSVKANL